MHNRWNLRRISLWTFLLMQIILVVLYFSTQIEENSANTIQHNLDENAIVFISTRPITNITKHKQMYYNEKNTIILTSRYVEDSYADFNTSLCYRSGTDLSSMKRHKDVNWKCLCLPDWHGNDCGQPEVVWRALMASRKPRNISGPRKIQRRLIYFTEIDDISADFIEITLLELNHVTDLFILYDINSHIKTKLNSGFLKDVYSKILYVNGASKSVAWKKAKRAIRNLRDDDIFLISDPFEIPNVRALMFLKLYDHWPQPLTFRLRWSVYGFFWKHPQKTTLATGACTIHYLYEALEDNLDHFNYKFISNESPKMKQGFIVGDLNHFGGWFCEFCAEPSTILKMLQRNYANTNSSSVLERLVRKKIDVAYLEDLIENGVYIDGKMELQRAHRYNEHYYAPVFVNNNSWKFDWLLTNLYSKLDYY